MKFYIFGKEFGIRKEFFISGLFILIILLALWGGYLKSNRVEVFNAGDKPFPQSINESLAREKEDSGEIELININTEGIETLILLNGIGEVKARAIIEYRELNGLFKNIEEIKNVKGIGDATFLKIKDRITVEHENDIPAEDISN